MSNPSCVQRWYASRLRIVQQLFTLDTYIQKQQQQQPTSSATAIPPVLAMHLGAQTAFHALLRLSGCTEEQLQQLMSTSVGYTGLERKSSSISKLIKMKLTSPLETTTIQSLILQHLQVKDILSMYRVAKSWRGAVYDRNTYKYCSPIELKEKNTISNALHPEEYKKMCEGYATSPLIDVIPVSVTLSVMRCENDCTCMACLALRRGRLVRLNISFYAFDDMLNLPWIGVEIFQGVLIRHKTFIESRLQSDQIKRNTTRLTFGIQSTTINQWVDLKRQWTTMKNPQTISFFPSIPLLENLEIIVYGGVDRQSQLLPEIAEAYPNLLELKYDSMPTYGGVDTDAVDEPAIAAEFPNVKCVRIDMDLVDQIKSAPHLTCIDIISYNPIIPHSPSLKDSLHRFPVLETLSVSLSSLKVESIAILQEVAQDNVLNMKRWVISSPTLFVVHFISNQDLNKNDYLKCYDTIWQYILMQRQWIEASTNAHFLNMDPGTFLYELADQYNEYPWWMTTFATKMDEIRLGLNWYEEINRFIDLLEALIQNPHVYVHFTPPVSHTPATYTLYQHRVLYQSLLQRRPDWKVDAVLLQ